MLSVVPVRKEPTHKAEMVSQLLFGENYRVTQTSDKWLFIKMDWDGYEGWIDKAQHFELPEKDFDAIRTGAFSISAEPISSVSSSLQSIPVLTGSTLPGFDGLNLKIGKQKFVYTGQAIAPEPSNVSLLDKITLRYLNAPYLWGGRSPFGIDCSGFSQVVFKFLGVTLQRDAYQQAEQGSVVNFVEETQLGDLAFFHNEEGRIIHVGIILKDQKIIHASGKVRIDKLDHFGIFNADTKKYSHQLKIIKRIF